MRILPKDDDRKRKHKKQPENNQVTKKPRQEEPPPAPVTFSGLDLTEQWINERLLPVVAAQIIMETLVRIQKLTACWEFNERNWGGHDENAL